MNKNKIFKIIIAIAIPLVVGGASSFLTYGAMDDFEMVNKPLLSPPTWLFPVAWTILYILMGIASYLIYKNNEYIKSDDKNKALILYGVQLVFNFFWSIIFFNLKAYYFAFFWLFIMWCLIIALMYYAKRVDKNAFYLLIPYILWTTFAGYLNIMIAILN